MYIYTLYFMQVLEAYRKIQATRQKKKTPTKKERDSAWKAIKERETIKRQIEGKLKWNVCLWRL